MRNLIVLERQKLEPQNHSDLVILAQSIRPGKRVIAGDVYRSISPLFIVDDLFGFSGVELSRAEVRISSNRRGDRALQRWVVK